MNMAHNSPDLKSVGHLGDAVGVESHSMSLQLTNLQTLCDAIMSTWSRV